MRPRILSACCALALLVVPAAPLLAEHGEGEGPGAAYQRNLEFVGGRAVALAEAIPAGSYGWRPMEGVRSVSESIMHMAAANYFFAGRMGLEAPEGVDPSGMEKITDKDAVVAALRESNEHLAKAFGGVHDAGVEADIFGRQGTLEDMMQIAIGHVHEHFGQLIAYARSNKVVPPWSAAGGGDGDEGDDGDAADDSEDEGEG